MPGFWNTISSSNLENENIAYYEPLTELKIETFERGYRK